jgi:hypothetical protein
MVRSSIAAVLVITFTGCAAPIGDPAREPAEEGYREFPVVNGEHDSGHPAVGMLGDSLGGFGCTATLAHDDRTIVTAAHCVEAGLDGQVVLGEGPNGDPDRHTYAVEQAWIHPGWRGATGLVENDIAVLRLAEPVVGIEPVRLGTGAPAMGEAVVLVGFGRDETGSSFGTRRRGENRVAEILSTLFMTVGTSGDDSGTCFGDSGGPALRPTAGGEELVGVNSSISNASCVDEPDLPAVHLETRLDVHLAFVLDPEGFEAPVPVSWTDPDDPPTDPSPPEPEPGWIGDACIETNHCGSDTLCRDRFGDGRFPDGLCTERCTRYCPDRAGFPTTFCADLGDAESGYCVLRCTQDADCRAGYSCVEMPRYGEPETAVASCVPTHCADPGRCGAEACETSCTDAFGAPVCAGETGFTSCLSDGVRRCRCGPSGTWIDCQSGCIS